MAPLCDVRRGQFVGVLSAYDFILILREVRVCRELWTFSTGEFSKCKLFLWLLRFMISLMIKLMHYSWSYQYAMYRDYGLGKISLVDVTVFIFLLVSIFDKSWEYYCWTFWNITSKRGVSNSPYSDHFYFWHYSFGFPYPVFWRKYLEH